MTFDGEPDAATLHWGGAANHAHDSPLGLLFPRNRSQIFMPLTAPRRNSHRPASIRAEYIQNRSQVLLERHRTPAIPWDRYRKSEEEIKAIKNKKVRRFYEDQVGRT